MITTTFPPMLTENAIEVMNRRIVPRDENGTPLETPAECFLRVARAVAAVDTNPPTIYSLVDEFYKLMASGKFIPNSPALVNAGRDLGMMSACFVLPVEDSIEGIFESVKHTALIHKSGGGTGFSFSRLRKAGSFVGSTSGVASGPVSFMRVFDAGTEAIKQGGTRRGANMGILSVDHPDIWEFIHLKSTADPLTGRTLLDNFNVSVAVTDDFMLALQLDPDAPWMESGHTAGEIWRAIAESAWKTGDPGLVFLDRVNASKSNPVPSLGPIEATNPCGEQPLYAYDSCNLGSINLAKFVRPDVTISGSSINCVADVFDAEALDDAVRSAVRFLDNVITANKYPLPQIEEMTRSIRRIGLGVMGWADVLIVIGLPYDSPDAIMLGGRVMEFVSNSADSMSRALAYAQGAFPLFSDSIYAHESHGIRNSTRTTIAPTGTISIIAGCSSGIEPLFAPVFRRRHKLDRDDADAWFEMFEIHPAFKRALEQHITNPDERKRIIEALADEQFTISDFVTDGVLPDSFLLYRGANEIPYPAHIAMQAAFQQSTDNGVSKTINLPESATVDDIATAYALAYQMGCHGITVYRHNCRAVQVLGGSHGTTAPTADVSTDPGQSPAAAAAIVPVRRKMPAERAAVTHKLQIGDLEGYLTVGMYPDGTPGELFLNISKQGSTVNGLFDTAAMLLSYCLQYGVPLEELTSKLIGVAFEPSGFTTNRSIPTTLSVVDYVARWLQLKFLDPTTPATFDVHEPVPAVDLRRTVPASGKVCPTCGIMLVPDSGCSYCPLCGFQAC